MAQPIHSDVIAAIVDQMTKPQIVQWGVETCRLLRPHVTPQGQSDLDRNIYFGESYLRGNRRLTFDINQPIGSNQKIRVPANAAHWHRCIYCTTVAYSTSLGYRSWAQWIKVVRICGEDYPLIAALGAATFVQGNERIGAVGGLHVQIFSTYGKGIVLLKNAYEEFYASGYTGLKTAGNSIDGRVINDAIKKGFKIISTESYDKNREILKSLLNTNGLEKNLYLEIENELKTDRK